MRSFPQGMGEQKMSSNHWTTVIQRPKTPSTTTCHDGHPWRFCFAQAAFQAFDNVLQGADGLTHNLNFWKRCPHFLGKNPEITKGTFKKNAEKETQKKNKKNTPTRPTGQTSIHQVFGQIHPVISRILRFPKIKASTNCKAVRNQRMFFSLFFLKLPVELTIESPNHQSGGSWRPSWW